MTVAWDMAEQAARSARLLFESGDFNGATDRAYYAMFYGARAVLVASGFDIDHVKTHSGLLRMFSKHLLAAETLDTELGKLLKQTEQSRRKVTYDDLAADREEAAAVLAKMDKFLFAIDVDLKDKTP